MAVRGLGCPVRFTLTAGQKGDAPQAAALIEGLPAEVVMADAAYDADHLRQAIAAKGALAVIPNNPSRALKYPLDKHLYAQRHLVECCFSKLKQFRRVATRFEKTARNYRAVVTLAAIILSAKTPAAGSTTIAPECAITTDRTSDCIQSVNTRTRNAATKRTRILTPMILSAVSRRSLDFMLGSSDFMLGSSVI